MQKLREKDVRLTKNWEDGRCRTEPWQSWAAAQKHLQYHHVPMDVRQTDILICTHTLLFAFLSCHTQHPWHHYLLPATLPCSISFTQTLHSTAHEHVRSYYSCFVFTCRIRLRSASNCKKTPDLSSCFLHVFQRPITIVFWWMYLFIIFIP